MQYSGPDRRKNRVFVTDHTEYHLRGEICVGVRDVRTGEWKKGHPAIGSSLVCSLAVNVDAGTYKPNMGVPAPGDKLCFSADLLTSPLREVARPKLDDVTKYVSAAA